MAITVSDKNRREMSPERDFPEITPVRQRYCILSSPRSGSTMLGRALYETRLAGDPQEYFNPPLLAYERERSSNPSLNLNSFLKLMEDRRTSPNGLFGMKLHYSQMLGAFRSQKPTQNMLTFLKSFDQLIWIRRRDRLGQAISQAIGQHTQVWSSEDSRFGQQANVKVHPFQCVRAMQIVCGDDFGWDQLLRATGLKVHVVWYEDLVSDYESNFRQVLRHLGLEESVPEIPAPPTQRQAGELNSQLRARVVKYLGLEESAA